MSRLSLRNKLFRVGVMDDNIGFEKLKFLISFLEEFFFWLVSFLIMVVKDFKVVIDGWFEFGFIFNR